MAESGDIVASAESMFAGGVLDGVRVVVTAGPTREAIDPVRFISNHSSGKMGFAIARAAAEAGAATTLICGPVALETPENVRRIDVVSAQNMYDAVMAQLDSCDVFIGCAAVADYRPARVPEQKIKKQDATMQLELVQNPDIIAAVAASGAKPFVVGFAAETNDVIANARLKLAKKGLDMIVANDVSQAEAGFNSDRNAATILWRDGQQEIPLTGKLQLATLVIQTTAERLGHGRDAGGGATIARSPRHL
jgi:phosphopantothenoylcysteine decarboxylase/phosphopantothenate--cysteine ligase